MTGTEELGRRLLGVALGSLVVVAGGFLPWAALGEVDRSAFELVRVAGRNELLPDATAGLVRAWLLAPVLAGVVVVAVAYRRNRVALVAGAAVVAAAAVLAVAVWGSPMRPRYGVAVSAVGALTSVADAIGHAVRSNAAEEDGG